MNKTSIFFLLQNLKDQILTTNVWLEHVSRRYNKSLPDQKIKGLSKR